MSKMPSPSPSPDRKGGAGRCRDRGELTIHGWLKRRQMLLLAAAALMLPRRARAKTLPSGLPSPQIAHRDAYLYLTAAEAAFVDAAVSRLIPADELGPGALEAGVTLFIDSQLAGSYGRAADWYMAGPFADGTKQQGYQSQRTPAQVYRAAIAAIDERARKDDGAAFAALDASRRDRWLHALEGGKVELGDHVDAKTFFTLLWQNTQEGFFADPIYGGNRGFAGWKLIGYPGPRYNYIGSINRFGERYPLPTVGLTGRDPSRRPGAGS